MFQCCSKFKSLFLSIPPLLEHYNFWNYYYLTHFATQLKWTLYRVSKEYFPLKFRGNSNPEPDVSKRVVFLLPPVIFSAVVWLWQGGGAPVGGSSRKGNRAVSGGSDGGGGTSPFESSAAGLWRASEFWTGRGATATRARKAPQRRKSRDFLWMKWCPVFKFYYITGTWFNHSHYLWLLQERRITQQWEVLKKERVAVQKIAARAYTQKYMSGLLATVLTSLRTQGYFHDPVERGWSSLSRQQRHYS